MAERDPDTIKQDIDKARDQLASTVDSLAVAPILADSPMSQGPGDRLRQEARGSDLAGRDCSAGRRSGGAPNPQ